MKAEKFREMTDEELLQAGLEAQSEIFRMKVKKSSGDSAVQPLRVRTLRRDVARAKTIMRQRVMRKGTPTA